jgi:hypothetical protein
LRVGDRGQEGEDCVAEVAGERGDDSAHFGRRAW